MTGGLATIASTIRHRLAHAGGDSRPHAMSVVSSDAGERVKVGSTLSGDSLFVLERDSRGGWSLITFQGTAESWPEEELAKVAPDPLWESADSICSHMEADHADTFGLFLGLIGRADFSETQDITMPWVESEGFYLTAGGEHHFIPFPQRCEDANSVRATLIKMLRGARAANSSH